MPIDMGMLASVDDETIVGSEPRLLVAVSAAATTAESGAVAPPGRSPIVSISTSTSRGREVT